jgi:hypothetical protein
MLRRFSVKRSYARLNARQLRRWKTIYYEDKKQGAAGITTAAPYVTG